MVTCAWAHARGLDPRVEPLDRRTLLGLRAKVHDLRHRPFFEPLDPEGISHGSVHLRAGDLELFGHLFNGRLLRQRDHSRSTATRPGRRGGSDRGRHRHPSSTRGPRGGPPVPELLVASIRTVARTPSRTAPASGWNASSPGGPEPSIMTNSCAASFRSRILSRGARYSSSGSSGTRSPRAWYLPQGRTHAPAVYDRRERGRSRPDRWRVPKVPPKHDLSTPFPAVYRDTLGTNEGGRS